MASRFQLARMQAAARSANVAVRFSHTSEGIVYGVYADGNGDGVRASDIASRIDYQLAPDQRLPDQFPGVDFGVLAGLPPVESGAAAPGSDPLRLGAGDMASFTPIGTATPGSVYIRGRGALQFVVRILGETGRTRILKFNARSNTWIPL
jgi:hypothetical protein